MKYKPMKFLIDKSPKDVKRKSESSLVGGQLLTPLTRYSNWGGTFAIDNGAFSGFPHDAFKTLLSREEKAETIDRCLFVCVPDVVGSARRTAELFSYRQQWISDEWPIAFVCQDGAEDLPMPWNEIDAIFIGGCDPWKDSKAAVDLVKTAKTIGIHVHVGRVNTPKRYEHFSDLGADTCDGSGVAIYDHMLTRIEKEISHPQLFERSADESQ